MSLYAPQAGDPGVSRTAALLPEEVRQRFVFTHIGPDARGPAFGEVTLLERVFLDDLSARVTAAPRNVMLIWRDHTVTTAPPVAESLHRTAAQDAIANIRALSNLTNEQIAPLAGVSRRSLQAWIAGGIVSSRNEQRLRDLLDAIRRVAAGRAPELTRRLLLDRAAGNVCPYVLLAERRLSEAIDLALGRHRAMRTSVRTKPNDLAEQLSCLENRVALPDERLDRRLSGRLQR